MPPHGRPPAPSTPLPSALSRRAFLTASLAVGGGLIVGFGSLSSQSSAQAAAATEFGPWIRIAPDGRVTVLVNISEIGQGTHSALAQVAADELDVPFGDIRVEMAPVTETYINPIIDNYAVFGSIGVRFNLKALRTACAGARDMLIRAAAARWQVPAEECRAAEARVVHAASRRSLAYADLLDEASRLTPPKEPKTKPRSEWAVTGRPVTRLDLPAKVDGSAIFGIDVRRPEMLVATVRHSPTFGGRLVSVDGAPALAVKGVRQVVKLPDAVAVVADGYWPAWKGLQALQPVWDPGPGTGRDSVAISKALQDAAATGNGRSFASESDPRLDPERTAKALATATRLVEDHYEVPFLAHATMEPMNATAHVTAEAAELWLPTQIQMDTKKAMAAALGLPEEAVTINTTFVGGGFGRRLEHDFAVQAAHIARAVGSPVKMIWSRETDMRAGRYRPAVAARVRLALDADGMPTGLRADLANPSLLEYSGLSNGPPTDFDWTTIMGLAWRSYAIPAMDFTWNRVDFGVPCGYWRSVGASQNIFFLETVIDRAAREAGIDPVEYRRRLLADKSRALAFVNALADKAGWGSPLPKGHVRGFAMNEANRSISGHVVELSIPEPGRIALHRIVAAIDPGTSINPDSVEAQMMGGTIFGLSAALSGEITFRDGEVEQGNFDGYPLVSLAQMPPLETWVLNSGDDSVGGVGEEGVPSIAPAIANAIFAATGQPVTRLPLTRAGFHLV